MEKNAKKIVKKNAKNLYIHWNLDDKFIAHLTQVEQLRLNRLNCPNSSTLQVFSFKSRESKDTEQWYFFLVFGSSQQHPLVSAKLSPLVGADF